MTPAPDDRTPSLVVVAAGGIAVLVMLAFVAAVALGSGPVDAAPGERIAVVRDEGPAGLAVLVPRCGDERVVAVELRAADDRPLWRITSKKGSIDERYVVGAADPVPVGFDVAVPLSAVPEGEPLTAAMAVDRPGDEPVTDQVTFDPADIPVNEALYRGRPTPPAEVAARAESSADCGGDRPDLPVVAFAAAAAVAVGGYAVTVGRWWQARR